MPKRSRHRRPPARRPYHHGRLRQALLDAALEIVAERGPAALSIRETASRAGVSHAAPKRHFATVTELHCAVAQDGYRRLREHLLARAAEEPGATPLRTLALLGVAYVEFAVANTGHFRAMFHSAVSPASSRSLSDAAGAAFGVLVDAIARCQRADEVRDGPPRQLALGAWSIVHGLAILAVDHQLADRGFTTEDPVALAADVTQQLYFGLRP